jgi:hypothetical protein
LQKPYKQGKSKVMEAENGSRFVQNFGSTCVQIQVALKAFNRLGRPSTVFGPYISIFPAAVLLRLIWTLSLIVQSRDSQYQV